MMADFVAITPTAEELHKSQAPSKNKIQLNKKILYNDTKGIIIFYL